MDTYYRRCSSSNFIRSVTVPLLCISSLDDPVCTSEGIPWDECRYAVLVIDTEEFMISMDGDSCNQFNVKDVTYCNYVSYKDIVGGLLPANFNVDVTYWLFCLGFLELIKSKLTTYNISK